MKLSIAERSTLLGLLPKEGSFETLKALRKFKESLGLSEDERIAIHWCLEYKCSACGQAIFLPTSTKCGKCGIWMEPSGQAQWNSANDPNKDVFTPPAIMGIIVSTLNKLNERGKLTEELMPLFEKFIGGDKDETS